MSVKVLLEVNAKSESIDEEKALLRICWRIRAAMMAARAQT